MDLGFPTEPLWSISHRKNIMAMKELRNPLLVGIAAFVLGGNTAVAQEAATDSAESDFAIEEVIVTARKMDERLQDVPGSLTAFLGDTLRDRGAVDIKDVLRSVPGLANSGTERGLSRYSIRGLSTYASSPTVGIYLDDISLVTISTTFSGAYDPVFFDMQRLEVLKGPQGTLYGGSAMGGAIKYVSATPDLQEFSVDTAAGLAFTAHGEPSYNGEAVMNAPIVEGTLGLRAGVYYRREGGYVDNGPGDVQVSTISSLPSPDYSPLLRDSLTTRQTEDGNSAETWAGRLSMEWQPDDSWSIRPQIYFQDFEQGDTGQFFLNQPEFSTSYRIAQPTSETAGIYSLNIEKDLGGMQATSLTAYFDREYRYVRDYSYFIGSLIDFLYPLDSHNLSDSDTSTFSQEFRLASDADGPLTWLAGAYYSDQDDRLWQAVDTFGAGAVFGTDRLYFGDTFTNTKQYALFGEATYTFLENFDVTAGLRAFKIKQRTDAINDGLFNGGLTQVDDRRSEENGINPKLGLSYKFTPDNLVYTTAAKGFRPGGPNRYPINPAVCGDDLAELGLTEAPDTFDSDELWTYELGTKNIFGGDKVVLNAAAYQTDWDEIQQLIGLSCGFAFTTNLGSARVKGFELESSAKLSRGFEVGGTASYTDTMITEAAPGTSAMRGDELPNVPKWMATAYASYDVDLADGWQFNVRGEYQYQGKASYSTDPTIAITYADGVPGTIPNPIQFRESYDVFNLFLWLGRDDTEIRLYANNLLDASPWLDVDLFSGSDRATTIRPRTIGIELRQRF